MKLETYDILSERVKVMYEFISEGPRGRIMKVVEYSKFDEAGLYNLGLADANELTHSMNYTTISNNGDTRKVLTTIISTLFPFTDRFPEAKIYFEGNTPARTRLYRMAISNSINWLSENFYVFGLNDNKWQKFKIKVDYEAFLITRKNKFAV
jgi:hypothetical protein